MNTNLLKGFSILGALITAGCVSEPVVRPVPSYHTTVVVCPEPTPVVVAPVMPSPPPPKPVWHYPPQHPRLPHPMDPKPHTRPLPPPPPKPELHYPPQNPRLPHPKDPKPQPVRPQRPVVHRPRGPRR